MYSTHQGKTEILLWSHRSDVQRKRAHSPDADESAKRTRFDKYLDKMTEVEMIEEELKEKHSNGQYTDEQIRSWAHLIQMKKHSSYDSPPNERFWKVASTPGGSSISASASTTSNVSPGKRVNLRGQCVQQMQSTIMDDAKRFD